MPQDILEKTTHFVVQNEAESLSKEEVYKRLWQGTLSFTAKVYHNRGWIPLEQHPDLYTGSKGTLLLIMRNLDDRCVPYCTLIVVFLINLGSWIQEPHMTSTWAHGWSNVFLEGRWWSLGTGFIIHSSKSHFLSNVVLLLFLGWRVERAIGTWRCFFLVTFGLIVSSASIWAFESGMVVGSSSVVFLFWGAQIAIGLLFSLPLRHRNRYGWWGLLLLMVVFVSQLGTVNIAHSIHITGLLVGILGIILLQFRVLVVGAGLITLLGGIFLSELSFEKKYQTNGMKIVVPKDFVPHIIGDIHVWFHPFETTGWLMHGEDSSLEALNAYWSGYNFNTGFSSKCVLNKGCVREGDSHKIRLRIMHLGSNDISWIACVYPKEDWLWQYACGNWLQNVEATEPNFVHAKRMLMERYPTSEYHLEQYALALERWGYFQQADEMYLQLMNTDWKDRAEQHRQRIKEYLTSQ